MSKKRDLSNDASVNEYIGEIESAYGYELELEYRHDVVLQDTGLLLCRVWGRDVRDGKSGTQVLLAEGLVNTRVRKAFLSNVTRCLTLALGQLMLNEFGASEQSLLRSPSR